MAWQQFGRLPRPPTWLHAVGVKSSKCSGSPEAPGLCPRFVSLVYTERLPCCLRWMFLKTGRLRRHFCRLMEVWPENKAAPTGFYARARSQMIRNRALICRVLFLFHRRGFIWLQRDFTLCANVGKRSILQLFKIGLFCRHCRKERLQMYWDDLIELNCGVTTKTCRLSHWGSQVKTSSL